MSTSEAKMTGSSSSEIVLLDSPAKMVKAALLLTPKKDRAHFLDGFVDQPELYEEEVDSFLDDLMRDLPTEEKTGGGKAMAKKTATARKKAAVTKVKAEPKGKKTTAPKSGEAPAGVQNKRGKKRSATPVPDDPAKPAKKVKKTSEVMEVDVDVSAKDAGKGAKGKGKKPPPKKKKSKFIESEAEEDSEDEEVEKESDVSELSDSEPSEDGEEEEEEEEEEESEESSDEDSSDEEDDEEDDSDVDDKRAQKKKKAFASIARPVSVIKLGQCKKCQTEQKNIQNVITCVGEDQLFINVANCKSCLSGNMNNVNTHKRYFAGTLGTGAARKLFVDEAAEAKPGENGGNKKKKAGKVKYYSEADDYKLAMGRYELNIGQCAGCQARQRTLSPDLLISKGVLAICSCLRCVAGNKAAQSGYWKAFSIWAAGGKKNDHQKKKSSKKSKKSKKGKKNN